MTHEYNDSDIMNLLVKLKETIAQEEAKVKQMKKDRDALKQVLLSNMVRDGIQSINHKETGHTFYTSTVIRFSVADRQVVENFSDQLGNYSMFGNTLNSEFIKKYHEEHETYPPGINANQVLNLNMKKV